MWPLINTNHMKSGTVAILHVSVVDLELVKKRQRDMLSSALHDFHQILLQDCQFRACIVTPSCSCA